MDGDANILHVYVGLERDNKRTAPSFVVYVGQVMTTRTTVVHLVFGAHYTSTSRFPHRSWFSCVCHKPPSSTAAVFKHRWTTEYASTYL